MEDSNENNGGGKCPLRVIGNVGNYIEEILKLTLEGDGQVSLLKDYYCSNLLLNHDPQPHTHSLTFTSPSSGVPEYPLYRQMALALYECISTGEFNRPYDRMKLFHEESSWKQKENEWIRVIKEKGTELLNVLNCVDFELHVQEPYFSQLKDGLKTVEGRCAVGDYNRIMSGALILFNKCLVLQVQEAHKYASFSEMLESESLAKVLPGVKTIEQGVQVYRNFYSEEKERLNGVLSLRVSFPVSQPYITMSNILSELGYGGLQRLLGFVHTVGTAVEALPPPRSTLLSSFLVPHNLTVKGATLTDGARALAKHINRSSSLYWGPFGENDSDKNSRAMEVIGELVTRCCWQNMHIVPPHGVVYEIRTVDGYGARWSEDGTKFIGFLEPYMEDGHSKGWKH